MRAAFVVLALGACTMSAPVGDVQPSAKRGVHFTPDSKGLQVVGQSKRIDLGRSPKGVIPVLDRELGAGKPLALQGCPAGVVQRRQWNDLVLTFSAERFVGVAQGDLKFGKTCAEV